MSKPYQEELDRLERKDRRKLILAGLMGAGIALLTIFMGLFYYSGDVSILEGTVSGLTNTSGQYSSRTYLLVQLDNGRVVEARLPKHGEVYKGKRVVVEQVKNLFGYRTYYFKQYVVEDSPVKKRVF